jgi:hypothetical protein
MSETQSEQYTTPEFAATLSLPGGRTSLGTSPLGEHDAALNDAGKRTLQVRCQVAYSRTTSHLLLCPTAYFSGLAIPEVAVGMFPKLRPGFGPRSVLVGFVKDKVALRQVFSEYFGFPYQFSFHQLLHSN